MQLDSLHLTFDLLPAVISMSGALLVSRYDRWSFAGWLLWLISNTLWIGWAFTAGAAGGVPVWGVALQNVFFLVTSIKGMINSRRKFSDPGPGQPLVQL